MFAAGRYAPETVAGTRLLAHEVAHVVQQRRADRDSGAIVQRQPAGVEAAASLQSPRFKDSAKLEACFENKDRLRGGDPDTDAVRRVQQALLDLPVPGSSGESYDLGPMGADGIYGSRTAAAVRKFKRDEGLGFEQFGDVGPGTMHRLDQLFGPAPPGPLPGPTGEEPPATTGEEPPTTTSGPATTPPGPLNGACADGSVDQAKDPLPTVASPTVTPVNSAPELLELVKKELAAMASPQPVPARAPLGFTIPKFDPPISDANPLPLKVKAVPIPGSECMECVAEWELPTMVVNSFIAVGTFSDEKLFFAAQEGDDSGCRTTGPTGDLKPVRKVIQPEAAIVVTVAELEHFLDARRAYLIAGGRQLANARRPAAGRTHLRGRSQQECELKVLFFLASAFELLALELITKFGVVFLGNFLEVFAQSGQARDASGDHTSISRPPREQRPIPPNIDTAKNPFGCEAFFRRFDGSCMPHVPGPPAEVAIKDLNKPPLRSWHAL